MKLRIYLDDTRGEKDPEVDTEVATRIDLYLEDADGRWIGLHIDQGGDSLSCSTGDPKATFRDLVRKNLGPPTT